MNPLNPPATLLVALGSLIIHYEEWTSEHGVIHDKAVIDSIRNQSDVSEWIDEMNKLAMLPVKREGE